MARTGYIVGAGPQGRISAEVWRAQQPTIELEFLDDATALQGTVVSGIPVAGPVELLRTLAPGAAEAVLAVGSNPRRMLLAAAWPDVSWARLVHPSATVMPSAEVGAGSVVFAHAVINTDARVGRHVIVNTGVIIEHDVIVEDGCSISPGVSMGGRVCIGRGTFISAGVTLVPRVRIGAGSIIGAGAVVAEDIPPGVLAYGVPARVIRALAGDADFARML